MQANALVSRPIELLLLTPSDSIELTKAAAMKIELS